jgi:hypothetical protein
VAVYGTRMLGLWPMFKTKNEHMKKLFLFFIPANTLFILLGLLTLQTSGGLNIFNFLIVPILSFNIFAAMNLGQFKTKIFVPVFFVVALLTIPRSYFQLKLYNERYQINQTDSLITQDELEAFNYLRKQKNIVVQTTLENHYNFQTPYVSFLSNNPTYISGVSMLESHNQLTRDREANVKNALAQTDVSLKASLLADLGVTHFIISTEEYQKPNNWLAEVVFQNESITILRLR